MSDKQAILNVIEEIHHSLNHLAAKGCRGFECSQQSLKKISRWGPASFLFSESLQDIRTDLGDCRRCRLSLGPKAYRLRQRQCRSQDRFVGEGPGFEEDQKGEPFVGAAGQLLTKIIEAIKLNREQVYICNIIKCRPPGNRNPEPVEIEACSPFLERQLAAIKPEFICALGKFAAQTLLKTKQPISRLRGRFYDFKGIKLLPTYHPAFLLRNPDKKRDVWEDMKMLMREYRYED